MPSLRMSIALFLAVSSPGPALNAGVVVVAASGGGDFTDIAPAVAAAQEGDLILVHPTAPGGTYGPFTIDGKSLTVSAAHDGETVTTRVVRVQDLAAGQTVLLRGLTIVPKTWPAAPPLDHASGLTLDACAGTVRIEACHVQGALAPPESGMGGRYAISVTSCDDVGIGGCDAFGGNGSSSGTNDWDATGAGGGLWVDDSRVWVHHSTMEGGTGGSHFDPDVLPGEHYEVGDGGDGATVRGTSRLTLAGCALTGGAGGVQAIGASTSDGGNGLAQSGPAAPLARVRDCSLAGGSGTAHPGPADPIDVSPAAVQYYDLASRRLSTTSPAREGELFGLAVEGAAGDQALLVLGFGPYGQWFEGLQGPLLVAPTGALLLALGVVPGSGTLAAGFTVPSLGVLVEHFDVHLQLAILAGGGNSLENVSVVTLVDAAY